MNSNIDVFILCFYSESIIQIIRRFFQRRINLPTLLSRRKKAGYTRTKTSLSFLNLSKRQRIEKRKTFVRQKVSPCEISRKDSIHSSVLKVFKKRKVIPSRINIKPTENYWNQEPKDENAKIFRVIKVPW